MVECWRGQLGLVLGVLLHLHLPILLFLWGQIVLIFPYLFPGPGVCFPCPFVAINFIHFPLLEFPVGTIQCFLSIGINTDITIGPRPRAHKIRRIHDRVIPIFFALLETFDILNAIPHTFEFPVSFHELETVMVGDPLGPDYPWLVLIVVVMVILAGDHTGGLGKLILDLILVDWVYVVMGCMVGGVVTWHYGFFWASLCVYYGKMMHCYYFCIFGILLWGREW